MKVLQSILLACLLTLGTYVNSAFADAMNAEDTAKLLSRMQGTWYSENSPTEYEFKDGLIDKDKVSYIEKGEGDDKTFDARIYCVDSTDNTVFSYNIAFQNLRGANDQEGKNNYHESMTMVKSGKVFHRIKETKYFESVNGIYLEMPVSFMIEKIGQPEAVVEEDGFKVLKYTKLGLSIDTENDKVVSIMMYNWGNGKLDQSKLTAKNTRAEYALAYHAPVNLGPEDSIPTGYNEYIWVLPESNCVILTLLNH